MRRLLYQQQQYLMSSSSSASSTSRLAKEKFKRLIIDHNGDADHQDVKDALDELVRLGRRRGIRKNARDGTRRGQGPVRR